MLDARRFVGMFPDNRSKKTVVLRDMRCDTENGVWERLWSAMHQRCVSLFSSAVPFDMLLARHVDEVAYARLFHNLSGKYRVKSTKKECSHWSSVCCFELPYYNFYLVRDARDYWRERDFERWQRMNMEGRRFVGWNSFKMFAILSRALDLFYQLFEGSWAKCKNSRTSEILSLAVFSCMRAMPQSGTGLKPNLIQKVSQDA